MRYLNFYSDSSVFSLVLYTFFALQIIEDIKILLNKIVSSA